MTKSGEWMSLIQSSRNVAGRSRWRLSSRGRVAKSCQINKKWVGGDDDDDDDDDENIPRWWPSNLCNQDPLWAGAGHWMGMVGVVQIHVLSETSETFHTIRSSSCTYKNRIPMPSLANENQTQALSPKMQRIEGDSKEWPSTPTPPTMNPLSAV